MTLAATRLLEMLDVVEPDGRCLVLVFDPERRQPPLVYSNASAVDLAEALRRLLLDVEAGRLRMPVAGGIRWIDEAST